MRELDDYSLGIRAGDALSRKERVKSRRVRGMILEARSKAFKQENVLAERLHGLEQQMERKGDDNLYFMDQIWVLLVGSVIVKAHASRSPVLWAEIRESSLTGLELVQETIDKVVLVKEKPKMERDRQKSYVDYRRKPLEFEVGDCVLLKVTPWKGVVRFGKKGKLTPRYAGPFETFERIGLVAYRLRLPGELNSVHETFHVSNLKKCLGNANLHVPLNEIKIDKTLRFVEEPVEIMDREIKSFKRSRIPLVKVRWNSKCGLKFTWELEDYMKSKYPQLIVDRVLTEFKSGLMQQGAGLDELKHDQSTEESVAQKSALESSYFVTRENTEPNKVGSEEVADMDPDQLPTSAFVVLVSSIIPISNLSHKTFAHTLVSVELLRNSGGDSEPDLSFDKSASPECLFSSAHVSLAEASKPDLSFRCSGGDYTSSCPPILVSAKLAYDLNDLIIKYKQPRDLHPQLPSEDFVMSKLPNDAIGIYHRIFDFSGVRIPFSLFLLALIKHYRVHFSQLGPLGLNKVITFKVLCRSLQIEPVVTLFRVFRTLCKQGDWFSFAKSCAPSPVCIDDNRSCMKHWMS
ncbi:hypothetical protein Tco_1123489, partial [Tanacetum coccineum]